MQRLSAAVAFVANATFLAQAFGVRTASRKRRTGRAGWEPPASQVDLIGETLCTAGCAATAVAPLLSLLGVVPSNAENAILPGLALAMLGSGVGVALLAQSSSVTTG
ncbi:MAG: hypothetical protein LC749_04260, partial [Actinobacteria bacterium]|nr:hypothetical protein [Actinomycetota bacterium]